VATVRRPAALRQADGVRAALQRAAGGLANTADNVRGALQGLAEDAYNTGHFYRGWRFSERAGLEDHINPPRRRIFLCLRVALRK
jgi:hypothetical protein